MSLPVYKQYDQAALDAEFNLRARHTDFQRFLDRYLQESARVGGSLEHREDVPYGDSPLQAVDVFPARAPDSPVLLFIHGGYWQGMDKRFFGFPAETFVQAGAAYVTINYDLAPAVQMEQIVTQARRALHWCQTHAATFNGDPGRIHVCGHSAGGHLAVMASLPWEEQPEGPPAAASACAISGVFDLEPIRLSYLNAVLKLDAAAARRHSPLYALGRHGPPLIAAVGGAETNEFRRQTGMLATAWRARGLPCEELTLPRLNHFDILLDLLQPDSRLSRAILGQMGL